MGWLLGPVDARHTAARVRRRYAHGQEPDKKYAKEYHHAFKGDPPNPADIRKMGPGNAECVKFEPEGLRISLPQGLAGNQAGTGVATGFGVSESRSPSAMRFSRKPSPRTPATTRSRWS